MKAMWTHAAELTPPLAGHAMAAGQEVQQRR